MEQRALVWAGGRDGILTCDFLRNGGFDALACDSASTLLHELSRGVGVVIVAAELLAGDDALALRRWLGAQPPWSDTPILVIAGRSNGNGVSLGHLLEGFGSFSVLHRPLSLDTLYSTVAAALQARRRQYQVRDLLHQRDETDRRREEFLAMLAHELRNPLAPIRTGLQLLRLTESADMAAKTQSMIERQLGNLTRLIDDLLDVSRITRGKISLRRQVVDLRSVVANVTEARLRQASEKGIDLVLESPQDAADASLSVDADPVRLEQVVDNVVSNAIKFTPPNGRVTLRVARESDSAVVRVRDTGVGIPAHMLDTVFELFAQTERTLDRTQGGLGIGLTVVRTLVQLHGGSVQALSDGHDRGSEIVIRLPVLAPAEDAPASSAHAASPVHGTPKKVLIVEDNRDTAELIAEYLQTFGHAVRVVYDGVAGLEAALRDVPQAIICDVGLPAMDGYEFARQVRRRPPLACCRLIAVTGYGEPRDRERGLEAGFDHYLVKPADPETIAQLIA